MKTPSFEAHVTRIHYGIEVSIPLHTWLECGGMRPNGFPPDGSDPKDVEACDRRRKVNDARAEHKFEQFNAISGISSGCVFGRTRASKRQRCWPIPAKA